MNLIDQQILLGLNQFARRSVALDHAVNMIAHANLVKGYVMVGVLVWLWSAADPEKRRRNRQIILCTAVAGVFAIAFGKLLEHTLPFRPRPVHTAHFGFVPPFGGSELILESASAFPSDHAVFFSALATGVWFISGRLGVAAHLYALIVIYLPRLYVGFHYPTDIMGGAAIGIAFTIVANQPGFRRWLAEPLLGWAERNARLSLIVLFLGAIQFATLFLEAENLYSEARLVFCLTRHRHLGGPDVVMERCTRRSSGVAPEPPRSAVTSGRSEIAR